MTILPLPGLHTKLIAIKDNLHIPPEYALNNFSFCIDSRIKNKQFIVETCKFLNISLIQLTPDAGNDPLPLENISVAFKSKATVADLFLLIFVLKEIFLDNILIYMKHIPDSERIMFRTIWSPINAADQNFTNFSIVLTSEELLKLKFWESNLTMTLSSFISLIADFNNTNTIFKSVDLLNEENVDFSPGYYEDDYEINSSDNFERDTFNALTDGLGSDYDEWKRNGGDMGDLTDSLGH